MKKSSGNSKRRPELDRSGSRGPTAAKDLTHPLTKGRLWLFRIISMILLPLLLLSGVEAGLRLAGYGYSTSLLTERKIGDEQFLVNNEDFSLRFFPPQLARLLAPVRMSAQKSPGTYRIFILGESAAMGDPEPAYAASRYLEAMLSARYPQTHFEVVNFGITAINSHVILPIAHDCARHGGDLWIVYMGNNEMVGPFGAATVFGAKAPLLAVIRLNLAIQKTRLGQLLVNIVRGLEAGKSDAVSWGGMEMFVGNQLPVDDPRKEVVYQNFSQNLHDIVKAGLESGANILLNTVAVNLKDCAPFASLVNTNLTPADRTRYDQLFAAGEQAENQRNFVEAAQQFTAAAGINPKVAELQYRLGQNLLAMTNYVGGREHLQLACDDDALPFRADSRINNIIRNEGKKTGDSHLVLFDAASTMAASTASGLCGEETFYEHVHFNFDGNYRLGRAWAEQVAAMMPSAVTNHAVSGWATQEVCERRLGLSDWNRSLVMQNMINRLQQPPLNTQPENEKRLKMLQRRVQQLHMLMTDDQKGQTRKDFEEVLKQWPDDYYLHENFDLFLESIGDLSGAAAESHAIHDLIPQDCVLYFQQGRVFAKQGQYVGAESSFRKAVTIRPSLTDAWVQLGDNLALEGKYEAALASYETAIGQSPRDAQTYFFCGIVLVKMKRHAEAIEHYRRAIELNPSNWAPHFELGRELDSLNQISEAGDELAAAVRLNPNYSHTHFNYGVLLAKQGQIAEAQGEFQKALRLDPGYKNAQDALMKVQELNNSAPSN
jgi:tetratricopeptide (TPR) repeat protein